MSILLEKPIQINRIMTTSIKHARAIEDPIRAKIVEMLYQQILSAEQISTGLKKLGYDKALTTIRHHLDILKESGLIEIAKIEETRGAVLKFYSTSVKLLGYDIPTDFDEKYSKLINKTITRIEKIITSMDLKTTKKSDEYSQYLIMEIMNRAMTNILENMEKPK